MKHRVHDSLAERPDETVDGDPTANTRKSIPRRDFLALSALGLTGTIISPVEQPGSSPVGGQNAVDDDISISDIAASEKLSGLEFSDEHRTLMLEDIAENREDFEEMRKHAIPNSLFPALQFDPRLGGAGIPDGVAGPNWVLPSGLSRPSDEDLAYMSIYELSGLIRAGQISSVELTTFFLNRLETVGRQLEAVVTVTTERALREAEQADAALARGEYRGPLHGIPYGAKDLLSASDYLTTWGAMPYKDQVIDEDATVVRKLREAGAVLAAKLTLGALAWGDVWYGGKTRNPWNIEQGSSGSSAGPGAAVASGCVPFAIGSETLGSIVSPSTRTGVTGHRPTYGLVSRTGAMTLSWSMDKLGPMTRSARDCAIVLDAIRGRDTSDPSTVDAPFPFNPTQDVGRLSVGYLSSAFEEEYDSREADLATLEVIRSLGVELREVKWPDDLPVGALLVTLNVEAAAAFDELTRTGGVDSMVRQIKNAWPNVFRASRFVPAVEYLQANRLRVQLMRQMHEVMKPFDVVVSPSFQGGTLRITNLTGHPTVCVPNRFGPVEDDPDRRRPGSISFVGRMYGDAAALELAHAYQQATDFHLMRPPVR